MDTKASAVPAAASRPAGVQDGRQQQQEQDVENQGGVHRLGVGHGGGHLNGRRVGFLHRRHQVLH
jgi:hypothetical protein